ncbi:MAG: GlsB/YeaQ/YmgE family stress response membrane protein [Bacillota bacterium]|nr:GlsB/YeaQ/YmgE family stress response membrane protein [Bacillota bacterium]MDW7730471.1 GlsB/YeaQ/YmgE family stress response membrane protein [Bacillota bacterium]
MGFLTWIIVGAIVGWLAGIVVKGRGFGLIGNIVIGVIGALIGGWLAGALFNISDPISGFNLTTIFIAFLGAVLLLFIARLVKSR